MYMTSADAACLYPARAPTIGQAPLRDRATGVSAQQGRALRAHRSIEFGHPHVAGENVRETLAVAHSASGSPRIQIRRCLMVSSRFPDKRPTTADASDLVCTSRSGIPTSPLKTDGPLLLGHPSGTHTSPPSVYGTPTPGGVYFRCAPRCHNSSTAGCPCMGPTRCPRK